MKSLISPNMHAHTTQPTARALLVGSRRRRRFGTALVIALLLLTPLTEAGATTLNVFAAASLSAAFTQLGTLAQHQHPGWHVQLNFAGSQQLAMQIEQGAPADLFASANEHWTDYLHARGLLAAPQDFAHNRLVVIIPKSNPGRITRLQDLARPGVKMVIGVAAVPVGRYSRVALAKLAATPGFGTDFAARVLRNVVSYEQDVKEVVAKVQLGEADAGMVYVSDVTAAVAPHVRRIDIPAAANVIGNYSVGILKNAKHAAAAHDFVRLLLSPAGQQVLRTNHLMPLAQH